MTEHAHQMPFGAQILEDGSIRFRLWAPAARSLELCLATDEGRRCLTMERGAGGWFEQITRGARPGDLYTYRIDGDREIPDPASRFQPSGVHGPSEIIDPAAFAWGGGTWEGRAWEEVVFYELHVGAFSPEGTFPGVTEGLDYLVDLGVTAIELMPIAAFPGRRNWGYDGVLPFAPDASYGRPEDLKALVRAAHERGLMVFLDVVYNHFGPEGNYLHLYAPRFFTERHQTPWGAGINFDGEDSREVRDFFIHNALYWLDEYRLDGLRLDAVHAIADNSDPDILVELAESVREGPGRQRRVHLVLENDNNAARYLARRADGIPRWYAAQWNDDFHHVLHLITTGERDGYYVDYVEEPMRRLGRCLAEGFAFQGEASVFRNGAHRGEPSGSLPPLAFVNLLQNHDQVGNRAFGERMTEMASPQALRAALTILLMAPSPPLIFMGQEFMTPSPFLYFCDFGDDLAGSVTEGRRREFARFERFADPHARKSIPDPNDPETFRRSKLDWSTLQGQLHADCYRYHRKLLEVRRQEIIPRLAGMQGGASFELLGGTGFLRVYWRMGNGAALTLTANLAGSEHPVTGAVQDVPGRLLWAEPDSAGISLAQGCLPPWSAVWHLETENPDHG
jgi:malto-oligosyltrehalose trehalohydrolase